MTNPLPATSRTTERENRLRTLGANIRRERVARHVSQDKLATAAGLYVRTIARIEAGELNVRPETLARIEAALGCRFRT